MTKRATEGSLLVKRSQNQTCEFMDSVKKKG